MAWLGTGNEAAGVHHGARCVSGLASCWAGTAAAKAPEADDPEANAGGRVSIRWLT